MDLVGHLTTFQNIALQPLSRYSYRVIAPIVQNVVIATALKH